MSKIQKRHLQEMLINIMEIGSLEMQQSRGYFDADAEEKLNILKANFKKVTEEGEV